ncbi:MAG TPA: triose-phosphate isomerase [Microbacteriaceae bacterium]|nr:triose-phosphate isomerase [Microbacteriaceae bacterium]
MALTRIPLIVGNWKMHLDHFQAIAVVQKLGYTLQDARHSYGVDGAEVVVLPPFTDLRSVQNVVAGEKALRELRFGAQDLSVHDAGAYTGEVSGAFLKALECRYVLVGHSERRTHHGETDETVAAKTLAALRHGLVPIVCVGETAEDLAVHGAAAMPLAQLRAVLEAVRTTAPDAELVVAYEPVWAIGSGHAASPEQAQEVAAALRALTAELLGAEAAGATRVLYGGSVNSGNIAAFLRESDLDGALVGGASLDASEFAAIARFQKHVGV